MITLIEQAHGNLERIAIKSNGRAFTYKELLNDSKGIAIDLLDGKTDLTESRIAFIVDPGYDYVKIQWGIWRAGGIAVPLCVKHPYASIKYVIDDTNADAIIYSKEYTKLISPLLKDGDLRTILIEELDKSRKPVA